jgi:uncharacterized membrane protein YqgA involved in biofilm formation
LQGVGLSVIVIGISGTLVGMLSASSGGQLERSYVMTMIFSLLIGGVIGELLKIEDRLNHVGVWLHGRLKGGSGMSEGFVSATLLFCVGAMSIVGSIQDGLTGNASTLYAKSILDGVMAAVLASTMGFGVVFSAVSVFVYQGSITLLAGGIKPWLTDPVIAQVSVVGNILIIAIGINVLGLKKIKVGNLIPSVFLPFIYYLITQLILKIKI